MSDITSLYSASREKLSVTNPYDQTTVGRVELSTPADVNDKLEQAYIAQEACRKMTKYQRSNILRAIADNVNADAEGYAKCIVAEAGKTIRQARKEVARCINTIMLSAEEAKRIHGETLPFDACAGSDTRKGYYEMEPMGLVVGITPYNDPLNLVAHKLGPAIASGNSFVLKPSEITPLSALKLCQAAWDAGYDKHALNIVNGGPDVGRALVSHPQVRVVSFTGGLTTADKIVKAAGVKKFIMDLGGNAPVVICDDANLTLAADSCVSGAFWAAGQNCVGVQRILVQEPVYDRFRAMLLERIESLLVGDPTNENTDMGPMITAFAAKKAWSVVADAVAKGAKVLIGKPPKEALFYPTVVEGVTPRCGLWREEIFAPVVCLESFVDINSAIELSNQPESSLHAGIFTSNLHTAHYLVDHLKVGGVMINDSSDYRSDLMPFGGFKAGSMGREGVRYAISEMMQSKVICMNL